MLIINGEPSELAPGTTVAELVRLLECGTRGVAVAVNQEIVRRADWPAHRLADGDEIEVLHAVAGG